MLNTESRNKVQASILEYASNLFKQKDDDTVIYLAKITGFFLDLFIVNLKAELDDLKLIDEVNLSTQITDISEMQETQEKKIPKKKSSKKKKKILPDSFIDCKAIPRWLIINTNIISSTLERMRLPTYAEQIENTCIQMNIQKRDESFAALKSLPFVSSDAHLLLAKDLEEGGTITTPEEVAQLSIKRKRTIKKKTAVKKSKNKNSFFF